MATPTVKEITEFYITISDSGDITTTQYTMLAAIVTGDVANLLKTTTPDVVKNHIQALMILHIAELKGIGSFASEKIDGYSYRTKEGSATKYSDELNEKLKRWSKRPDYTYTPAFVRDGDVFMDEDDLVEE